jgi:hypothetical protein
MKAIVGVLVAAVLAVGSGCAKQDWIDRTLVTVDVTGTWSGVIRGVGTASRNIALELEQKGSGVKGSMQVTPGTIAQTTGPLEGIVSGDEFRFRSMRGDVEGELTVDGDQMNGTVAFSGQWPASLRRIDPSSPQASPPR